jgi:O-antigen ligase
MKFRVYLIFIVSYFLHLPSRIAVLGVIRFDLLLVCTISGLILLKGLLARNERDLPSSDHSSTYFWMLMLYVLISLPFVEWPGSVIRRTFFVFLKAVVFYLFTLECVDSENELKWLLCAFLGCQFIRILEPTWLHVTTGYWGSATHIGEGGWTDRLSGAPHDVVNPNGLAFLVLLLICLGYFMTKHSPFKIRLGCYLTVPILTYALLLTKSRTGIIGLSIVLSGIIIRSKKKILWVVCITLAASIIFINADPIYQDRWLSINVFRSDLKGSATAHGRISGWISGFQVFLNKPLFGHGLGTSSEAAWHTLGHTQVVHNFYLEVLQEFGIIGFLIYTGFIKGFFRNLITAKRALLTNSVDQSFLLHVIYSLETILVLQLALSLASYGVSVFPWYFFGGVTAVIHHLVKKRTESRLMVT